MALTEGSNSLISILPLASAALVPGWAWVHTERRVWLRCKESWQSDLFRYGMYSLVLFVGLFTLYPIAEVAFADNQYENAVAVAMVGLSLLPFAVLGGVITGVLGKKDVFGKFLKALHVQVGSHVDTGWQEAFQRTTGCIVKIVYKDNTETFAVLNPNSVVAEPTQTSDAYFEQTFVVNKDGELEPTIADLGVWVRMSEVKEIRLYEYQELNNDEARTKLKTEHRDNDKHVARRDQRGGVSITACECDDSADCESVESREIEIKSPSTLVH